MSTPIYNFTITGKLREVSEPIYKISALSPKEFIFDLQVKEE